MPYPAHRPFTLLAALLLASVVAVHGVDAATLSGNPLSPLEVPLTQGSAIPNTPAWFTGSTRLTPDSDAVEITLPSLTSQEDIGCYALTVVFEDNGDGGPVAEWISNSGERTLLSAGLGDNGVPIGPNARTILLSQSLTLDGGTARVSFAGRFSRLRSVTVHPCREVGVASLGDDFKPALILGKNHLLGEEETSGADRTLRGGDRTEGNVVHAELSTPPAKLETSSPLEVIVPLGTGPKGSWLHAEIAGLDPESWIEVTVNGESFGAIGMEPFPLQDPGTLFSKTGRMVRAGWRSGSLYLPARIWNAGENSVLFTLRRVSGDEGKPVHVRNTSLDFLFPQPVTSSTPPPQAVTQPAVAPSSLPPASTAVSPAPDTLSTGSEYGHPSPALFHAAPPAPVLPR